MKGARKNAQGMITEPGNMVIYVAVIRQLWVFSRFISEIQSSPSAPGYRQRRRKQKDSRTRWLPPADKPTAVI
jgi:hypothetical protein